MMRITKLLSAAAGLALALATATAASAGGGATPASPATVKLYKSQCSTCHGLDGKGKTTAGKKVGIKDWTDGKTLKALSDADIAKLLRLGNKGDDGKQRMPPFKKLTDDQIKALIAYVRFLQR